MRKVAFSRRISVRYAESGKARDNASRRITLELEVSFKNHARSAGELDAAADGVWPPWICRCNAFARAAMLSLSSRSSSGRYKRPEAQARTRRDGGTNTYTDQPAYPFQDDHARRPSIATTRSRDPVALSAVSAVEIRHYAIDLNIERGQMIAKCIYIGPRGHQDSHVDYRGIFSRSTSPLKPYTTLLGGHGDSRSI